MKENKKETKVRFRSGEREYTMKVKETLKNGDVRLIDSTLVEKKNILETIKI